MNHAQKTFRLNAPSRPNAPEPIKDQRRGLWSSYLVNVSKCGIEIVSDIAVFACRVLDAINQNRWILHCVCSIGICISFTRALYETEMSTHIVNQSMRSGHQKAEAPVAITRRESETMFIGMIHAVVKATAI